MVAVLLTGCEALYQSYDFSERMPTGMPVQVVEDEVWVTSIPEAADVYVQPYDPEEVPSHDTDPEAYRGKTPLRLTLPPGSYWVELAFDAEVFDLFFDPPYDDVQFEQAGATYEALLFQPLTPGAKRRVLRYYRLDKQAGQGQTLIALFHPRGQPLERVLALYPQSEQFTLASDPLNNLLQQLEVPPEAQERLLFLMRRGGKAFWRESKDTYRVALEARQDEIQGQIVVLYTGHSLCRPPCCRTAAVFRRAPQPSFQCFSITSIPPMNGCKTSGIATLPSARWYTSSSGMRMRGEATTVLFRVWTKRSAPSWAR